MVVYEYEDVDPNVALKLAEYIVPKNIMMQLESICVWSAADGQFTLYKNGESKCGVRVSGFNQTQQVFFGESLGLSPMDVISVYGYHGQSTPQMLSCTLMLKQL